MSTRAGGLLKEEMEYMGPVRQQDVADAQNEIESVMRKLRDNDEIRVARSGEELIT